MLAYPKYCLFFIIAVFLLYSPLARAGGVIDAIASVIVPVLIVVVIVAAAIVTGGAAAVVGLALAPGVFTAIAGTVIVSTAIGVSGLVLADCFPGSPIDPGLICDGNSGGAIGGGSGDGGETIVNNSASKVLSTVASPTCTSLTLNGINSQGHSYAIVRGGNIIAELPASQTSFADFGLIPHTNYQYFIRIPYPPESGFATTDSDPINGYTKCLPQCSFGVDSLDIVEFGLTNLRWKCLNNNPTTEAGKCEISDSISGTSKDVNPLSGMISASPRKETTYTLTCANIDGAISIPQTVNILKPGIKEVKP